MYRWLRPAIVGWVAASALTGSALAESSAEDANKSNNPLNLVASFNIQNFYTPRLLVIIPIPTIFCCPTIPLAPGSLIGVPQIIRGTVPVSTHPKADGSYETGLGDINLLDIFLLHTEGIQIGAYPGGPRVALSACAIA